MANALYDLARQAFLTGGLSWTADDVKVVLVDTGAYTVDLANHQYLSSIAAGARIATSSNLTNKTATGGVADADDVTLTAVTGVQSEALVLYKDTGNAATSPLIAYIDTSTGLPITPNGADIIISWNNGTNKIFKL